VEGGRDGFEIEGFEWMGMVGGVELRLKLIIDERIDCLSTVTVVVDLHWVCLTVYEQYLDWCNAAVFSLFWANQVC